MSVCLVIGWSDGSHQGAEARGRETGAGGHNPARRWLGLDDRRWLLPCHHLHPGSDQVKEDLCS